MPTYDYVCANGHRFEVLHGVNDAGPTSCPICGSHDIRKAFTAPTIHFKGSGWAKKDRGANARKSSSSGSDGGSSSGDGAAPASKESDGSGSGSSSSTGSGPKESTGSSAKESSGSSSSSGSSEPG